MKIIMTTARTFLFSVILSAVVSPQLSSAANVSFGEKKPLQPASQYSGSAPIDLSNGLLFNNGTFGARNPNIEKWAEAPILFPGMNDLPYPFKWKGNFVKGLEESAQFVEAALSNWKASSAIKKPEAKEYSDKAIAAMEPQLAKLKEAIRTAASASEKNWDTAQSQARNALIEVRATYTSLHHNTH